MIIIAQQYWCLYPKICYIFNNIGEVYQSNSVGYDHLFRQVDTTHLLFNK